MRAVVVHESLFGNTARIAEAIAGGIAGARPDAEVECLSLANAAGDVGRPDLVVAGGPTHFLGITSKQARAMQDRYRRSAAQREPTGPDQGRPAPGPGLREWLAGLSAAVPGARAAAFDTRLDKPLAGGAAPRIAHRLARLGYQLAADPEGFIVEDMAGPLRAGELERARAWGAGLAERIAAASPL